MRVAVTYDNGQIFPHFGQTDTFKIYMIRQGQVIDSDIVYSDGCSGSEALAALLLELDADALICGGIGGMAVEAVREMGVKLYAGASGDADEAVASLLAGTLKAGAVETCTEDDCGSGCGKC